MGWLRLTGLTHMAGTQLVLGYGGLVTGQVSAYSAG